MKSFKKILSAALILILCLHTNYLAVYYSLFRINNESIVLSCCEKKVANCNGHCYLNKKMNDENEKNSNGTFSDMKLKLTEYVVNEFSPNLGTDQVNIFYTHNNVIPPKEYYSKIEHPPQS